MSESRRSFWCCIYIVNRIGANISSKTIENQYFSNSINLNLNKINGEKIASL